MDKDILTRFLLDLDSFQRTIQNVQQYCCQNDKQAPEIIELFMKIFKQARKDKKIYFFYSCHEIILDSQKRGSHYFIKSFGQKLKEIVKIICESQDSFDIIKKVLQIIDRWKQDKIYHPDFCDKLKNIIGPYYKELKEQYQKYYGEKDQKGKYTKTFIVNYLIVNEDEMSSDVYKSISDSTQCIQKLDKFNLVIDQFTKKNPSSTSIKDPKDREQLDEILSQAREYKESLIEKVEQNQKIYKLVSENSEKEINDYVDFSTDVIEMWQQKFKDLID